MTCDKAREFEEIREKNAQFAARAFLCQYLVKRLVDALHALYDSSCDN